MSSDHMWSPGLSHCRLHQHVADAAQAAAAHGMYLVDVAIDEGRDVAVSFSNGSRMVFKGVQVRSSGRMAAWKQTWVWSYGGRRSLLKEGAVSRCLYFLCSL